MPTYNRHVAIEDTPSIVRSGIERGIRQSVERDDRILAVLEDASLPGLIWLRDHYPDRIVQCGIAEQNAVVVAAGLAAEGFIPILHGNLFAIIERAYNQVRQSILVDRFNVKFVCRGGAWGDSGVSHNTVEDIGCTRVLPNLVILNPADAVESEKAAEAMMQYVGPVLLRQERCPPPLSIFADDLPFDIGKAFSLCDGADATIIATGYMLTEAIRALDLLEQDGLDVGLLDVCTLKPLDSEAIIQAARNTGAIVTAENGSIVGGLGDGVAAILGENWPTPMIRIGVEDEFSQSGVVVGEVDELRNHFALGAQDIAYSVRKVIEMKERLRQRG